MTDIREIHRSGDKLGEVPVWDVAEQALYWVDIEGIAACGDRRRPAASRVDLSGADRLSCAAPERAGWSCAFESGFAFYDLGHRRDHWIAKPEAHIARNRFNDGKCDRKGRFWAGTMDDRLREHTGALYRSTRI